MPGQPDALLAKKVRLSLVTSGRDLVDHQLTPNSRQLGSPPLVVADPDFDQVSGFASDVCPLTTAYQHQRSRDMGGLKVWQPLPGTAKEGRQLAELLGGLLHSGEAATTIAVQQARGPRVLHIATHGFFLPDQSEPPAGPEQVLKPPQCNDLLANFRGEDPLLRSGLVFAGANHPAADPEEDDGYLTAQEAIHLDLQGTELVTLSGCDTGRGDIHTGEGVYGLQRALIVAGARSLLLSLWAVPDEATCEFMVRFYTLLKQGAGRNEALVAVQKEFRQHNNIVWRHPYYWGAWQLIGDTGPIEGL
jgi:CHAT domain-containing protein